MVATLVLLAFKNAKTSTEEERNKKEKDQQRDRKETRYVGQAQIAQSE